MDTMKQFIKHLASFLSVYFVCFLLQGISTQVVPHYFNYPGAHLAYYLGALFFTLVIAGAYEAGKHA